MRLSSWISDCICRAIWLIATIRKRRGFHGVPDHFEGGNPQTEEEGILTGCLKEPSEFPPVPGTHDAGKPVSASETKRDGPEWPSSPPPACKVYRQLPDGVPRWQTASED